METERKVYNKAVVEMQNDVGLQSNDNKMENMRKRFEGILQQGERTALSDKKNQHDTRHVAVAKNKSETLPFMNPHKSPKGKKQPMDLPFFLGNLGKEDIHHEGKNTEIKSRNSTMDEVPETSSSDSQSGNNSSVLQNIRKYVNSMRSPRKSRGSIEEITMDSFLRKTRGRSLLQLEEIVPEENKNTTIENSTTEREPNFEDISQNELDSNGTKGNVKLLVTDNETRQQSVRYSPQPAPRLKINRQENAPKAAPRKVLTDVAPEIAPEAKVVSKKCDTTENIKQETLEKKSPKSRKASTSAMTFGSKRDSKKIHEDLLDVLLSDAGRMQNQTCSEEEIEEKRKQRDEERLKRQEEKRQQEEEAKIADIINQLEAEEMKKKDDNPLELQVQGAFVVCGEHSQENIIQPKSPKKTLREVKRRISTIRRTRKNRTSSRPPTPVTSPVRPSSDVIGNEFHSRRKSSTYKNKLSKVKRAMSMKVAGSASKPRIPNFSDNFTSNEDKSWHVDDGAVLNLNTRRARKSRNDSGGTPERSKTRKTSRTLTMRLSGNKDPEDIFNPVLQQEKKTNSKPRSRISKTVGFRQSLMRDDWDKITDFGGMKDRRAKSTTVESDNHLYEEIEESTIRALSWDNAFELNSPLPAVQSDGMQEYQFIDEVFAEIQKEAELCDTCDMDSEFSDSGSDEHGTGTETQNVGNVIDERPRLYSNVQEMTVEENANANTSDTEFDKVSILTVRESDDFYDQVCSDSQAGNQNVSRSSTAFTDAEEQYGYAPMQETTNDAKVSSIKSTKQWFKSRELMKKIFDRPTVSTPEDEYVVMQKNDVLIATSDISEDKKTSMDLDLDKNDQETPTSTSDRETGIEFDVKVVADVNSEEKKGSEERTPKRLAGLLNKLRFSPKSSKSGINPSEKKQKKGDSTSSTSKRTEGSKKEKKRKFKKSKKSKTNKSDFGSGQFLEVPDPGTTFSSDDFSLSDEPLSAGPSNQQSPAKPLADELNPLSTTDHGEISDNIIPNAKDTCVTAAPSANFLAELGVALRKTPGYPQSVSDSNDNDGLSRVRNLEIKGSRITSDIVIYDIPNSPAVKKTQEVHVDTPIPSPMHTTAAGERRNTLELGKRAVFGARLKEGKGSASENLPKECDVIYDVPDNEDLFRGSVTSVESQGTLKRHQSLAENVNDSEAIYDETPDDVFLRDNLNIENPSEFGTGQPTKLKNPTASGMELYDEPPKVLELAEITVHDEIYDQPPAVAEEALEDIQEIYDEPPHETPAPDSADSPTKNIEIYDVPTNDLATENAKSCNIDDVIYDDPQEEISSCSTSGTSFTQDDNAIYDDPADGSESSNFNNRTMVQNQNPVRQTINASPRRFVSPSLRLISSGSPKNSLSPSFMCQKAEIGSLPNTFSNDPDYADIDESEEEEEEDDYVDVSLIPGHSGATPKHPPGVLQFTYPDYDVLKRSPTSVERNEFAEYMKVLEIQHGQCAISTPYISVNRTPGKSIDQSGDIYVSDCHGDCMDIYSYKGVHKSTINVPGNPRGLASYTSRHVLCASSSRGEICVVDTVKGATLRKIGRSTLRNPRCVIMHPSNQTFVTSDIRQLRKWKVLLFDIRTGKPEKTIAANKDTNVGWPEFLTFKHGSDTEIYISDSEGHAVMGYDFRNAIEPTMTIGRRGHQNGEFISPCGVAHVAGGQITLGSAPSGSLLVADWGNNRVSAFDATSGLFQCHVIEDVNEDLRNPFDLKVDTCAAIYLTESGSNNIKVFHPI